ncbi:MAG: monovalent cation/H+ antiporter complex subunit F [Thermodesulfovibrio sp.]|uniref:monovalent cation/H+ antiporter complex subunit F n=1 Tax=unclassified Thermodesulfovibrio TaxID=2645936 RepID=UPI00083AF01E|nr:MULTISPECIES: monovalent cation/H+ antiporter complex subunit F [unclassified Thermodesulfovibrio]MDI1472248.1 monovalent cation/H+ antiporter complex subunit F [Thermodesulfovibrio sp. 1176]MDI6714110.1 monovalent cation/H+ antiporter complex subunit F [Thermodesulfovibrio sp.]ODA44628.1 sodium- potassium/hydrogen antiporter subunit F [Thermodesulfovibrio sp. N1]
MENFFIFTIIVIGILVILCLYRAIFGPTVMDRIVAVGVIGTKTTVILVLIGIYYKRVEMFVDISLAYALLNFIATLAASKFFRTRKSILPGTKFMKDREAEK